MLRAAAEHNLIVVKVFYVWHAYHHVTHGRCSKRPPITLRNHMICGQRSAMLQKQYPTRKTFNKLHYKENVFQLKS